MIFAGRAQRPKPTAALAALHEIPEGFTDDGCSNSPDRLFGFQFRWACRIHDWRYCTRSHPPGSMTQTARRRADQELAKNIQQSLPLRWRWVGWIYRAAVRRYGGVSAFDSCGPAKGLLCRHRQVPPPWMRESRG